MHIDTILIYNFTDTCSIVYNHSFSLPIRQALNEVNYLLNASTALLARPSWRYSRPRRFSPVASPPVPLGEILEGDVLNIDTTKLHHTEVHVGKEESVNWGWIWDGDTNNLHKLKIKKIKN